MKRLRPFSPALLLLSTACGPAALGGLAASLPGPVGQVAGVVGMATGVKATADTWSFMTDRRPVPMRGTYRITHVIGGDEATYFVRTAPVGLVPIMGQGAMGQPEIQGYMLNAIAAQAVEDFTRVSELQELEALPEEEARAQLAELGLGGAMLWVSGDTRKEPDVQGTWGLIIGVNFEEGTDPFFDRHRALITQYELGENQGGSDMFEDMDGSGRLTVTSGGAYLEQIVRGENGDTLFTIRGERISMETLDYGAEGES